MPKKKSKRSVVAKTPATRAPLPVNDRLAWVFTAIAMVTSGAFFAAGDTTAGGAFGTIAGSLAIAVTRRGQ
jgi:hypothetical protein